MNRNFKKIACFMATALLLTACSQDEMTDGNTLPEGKYPLQIASVTMNVESSEQPWGAGNRITNPIERTLISIHFSKVSPLHSQSPTLWWLKCHFGKGRME